MTDFEKRQIRNLGKAIVAFMQLPYEKLDKLNILLAAFEEKGDITLLAEFLSWFEE